MKIVERYRPADLVDLPPVPAWADADRRGRRPDGVGYTCEPSRRTSAIRPRCRGWLVTTTRRQCFRVRRAAAQLPQVTGPLMDADNMADTEAVLAEHELLLAERHAALRGGSVRSTPRLTGSLIVPAHRGPSRVVTAEISARLGIPIGSIGRARSRCLARLRRHPAVAMLNRCRRPADRVWG